MHHTTFHLVITLLARSLPAKRVGQGEVGGFQHWAQVIIKWLLLGLVVESHMVGNGWAISLLFAWMGLENGLLAM